MLQRALRDCGVLNPYAMDVQPYKSYLRTYKNVKERVNAMNFTRELESVYFDRSCQNGAFNI